jgi:peptidase M28-like protein
VLGMRRRFNIRAMLVLKNLRPTSNSGRGAISRTLQSLAAAAVLSLCMAGSVAAETLRFSPVSRAVIEDRLGQYGGSNRERQATLKRMFIEAGCGEQLSEQAVKRSKAPNLICVHPGTTGRVIIVGAHFDRVSAGDGVVDNWSGASLLPSLFQAVAIEPRQHSYVFIGFTEEEAGLIGSRFYVRQMTAAQIAATDAMVNLDTLGLASTNVGLHHSDKRLVLALGSIAKLVGLPVSGVNFEQVGSTDSESFVARKIPAISIHSLNQKAWNAQILHTSKDKLAAVRLDDYYDTYRLMAVYLVFLDHYFDPPDSGTPVKN